MRFSKTFVKTLRSAPKDETARGAQYLCRAGFVHKELAGVYDYLPLGLKTLSPFIMHPLDTRLFFTLEPALYFAGGKSSTLE